MFDKIAELLDWRDINSISMASSRLNFLVKNSKPFIVRTRFRLTDETLNVNEELQPSIYSSICVEIVSISLHALELKLTKFNDHLTSLKLSKISVTNDLELFTFLSLPTLSHLEELIIENLTNMKSPISSSNQLQLPKLTHLTIISSSSTNSEWIVDHLQSITELKRLQISREDSSYSGLLILEFLNKLEKLDCLDLTNVDLQYYSPWRITPKLKLKELKLMKIQLNSIYMRRVLSAMFQHGKKLTILGECPENLIADLLDVCHGTLEYMKIDIEHIERVAVRINRVGKLVVTNSSDWWITQSQLQLLDFFAHEANNLHVTSKLLKSMEPGALVDFPSIEELTIDSFDDKVEYFCKNYNFVKPKDDAKHREEEQNVKKFEEWSDDD